jgi:hypothetical protein
MFLFACNKIFQLKERKTSRRTLISIPLQKSVSFYVISGISVIEFYNMPKNVNNSNNKVRH